MPLLSLAILAGGAAYVFAELAAEVFHVAVAADFGDFQNGAGGIEQAVLGHLDAAGDNVVHAGGAEGFLVQ